MGYEAKRTIRSLEAVAALAQMDRYPLAWPPAPPPPMRGALRDGHDVAGACEAIRDWPDVLMTGTRVPKASARFGTRMVPRLDTPLGTPLVTLRRSWRRPCCRC